MEETKLRFTRFAADVIHISAPLLDNSFLEPRIKKLVSSSTRMGSLVYEAELCRNEFEYSLKIRSAIIELQESQYWIQILLNAKPDHLPLINLYEDSKSLAQLLHNLDKARMVV